MSVLLHSPVWEEFLHSLKSSVNRETFETWFSPIEFEGLDDASRTIQVRAPNHVLRDWVESNYSANLNRSLNDVHLGGYSLHWTIADGDAESAKEPQMAIAQAAGIAIGGRGIESQTIPAAAARTTKAPDPTLNSKYTFEGFVVGSCNQFAHAASLAVAEAPGKTYNPLYLYGGVGLGKTHLMHACGHEIRQRNPHLNLCYISSEKFMNELINAIRYDKTQLFREKYRSVDVLLIDDVQFMAGKERTQEEFFHTFNALYEQQKQIVISSDCPPREIPTLEERLHSRFEWGLIADLEPPDLETKIAILKRKAELMGILLDNDVALFIAARVKNNVRELEGSLIRLIAISS
ncbi:MAG TPA: chromosomal replication initiator protein DnaA, partial [Pyrinomonadaceae bacterium]